LHPCLGLVGVVIFQRIGRQVVQDVPQAAENQSMCSTSNSRRSMTLAARRRRCWQRKTYSTKGRTAIATTWSWAGW
jgi:hypothetical protein